MIIKKRITTVEEQEIDLQLPAFFKDKDEYFKINIDETVDMVRPFESHGMYAQNSFNSKERVAGYEPITEREWQMVLVKFSESVDAFVLKNLNKVSKSAEEIVAETNVS